MMPPRRRHPALHGSLLFLGATMLVLPEGATAAQLRFDAIGTLGGPGSHPTYGISDTGGLPLVGRSTGGTFVEWAGFWLPHPETTSGVPEGPEDLPPGDTPGNGPVLPLVTRLVGVFPNPVGRDAEIRFDIAPNGPGANSVPVLADGNGSGDASGSQTSGGFGTPSSGPASSAPGTSGTAFASGGESSSVRIELFDVNGRLAARVFDGDLPPGTHHLSWQPGSRAAGSVANGIYFFRFTCGNHQETRRIALLR